MKKNIIFFTLLITLYLPTQALAAPEDWTYFTSIITGLQNLAPLVQQSMQTLQQIQQQSNMIAQVQQGIRMVQDLQAFQAKSQFKDPGAQGDYIERVNYEKRKRDINNAYAQITNQNGILNQFIVINNDLSFQSNFSSLDTLLSILASVNGQSLTNVLNNDWNNIENTIIIAIEQHRANARIAITQLGQTAALQKKPLNTANPPPASGTGTTTGTGTNNTDYSDEAVKGQIILIEQDEDEQEQKLLAIKEKITTIKQATQAIRTQNYVAILDSASKALDQNMNDFTWINKAFQ